VKPARRPRFLSSYPDRRKSRPHSSKSHAVRHWHRIVRGRRPPDEKAERNFGPPVWSGACVGWLSPGKEVIPLSGPNSSIARKRGGRSQPTSLPVGIRWMEAMSGGPSRYWGRFGQPGRGFDSGHRPLRCQFRWLAAQVMEWRDRQAKSNFIPNNRPVKSLPRGCSSFKCVTSESRFYFVPTISAASHAASRSGA